MAPPSTPDRLPTREMYDNIVDVVVGGEDEEQKTFKLHKGILCFYSGYFDKAINGDFEEAREGVVKLPTEEVDIFSRFAKWLYCGELEYDASKDNTYGRLFQLWVFADRRDIPLMMNTCIDLLITECARSFTVPLTPLNFIFDNTIPGSPLRRFAIHIIGLAGSASVFMKDETYRASFPADALWDLMKLVWDRDNSKKLGKKGMSEIDACQFHQHEDGVTCAKKDKK